MVEWNIFVHRIERPQSHFVFLHKQVTCDAGVPHKGYHRWNWNWNYPVIFSWSVIVFSLSHGFGFERGTMNNQLDETNGS
jgi:hypothetical protein